MKAFCLLCGNRSPVQDILRHCKATHNRHAVALIAVEHQASQRGLPAFANYRISPPTKNSPSRGSKTTTKRTTGAKQRKPTRNQKTNTSNATPTTQEPQRPHPLLRGRPRSIRPPLVPEPSISPNTDTKLGSGVLFRLTNTDSLAQANPCTRRR